MSTRGVATCCLNRPRGTRARCTEVVPLKDEGGSVYGESGSTGDFNLEVVND